MDVFNISIEFDKNRLHQIIEGCISHLQKGYVCFVDANVLSVARKDIDYLKVLQGSMINSCDGGSIAAMVNMIYKTNVKAYNGPDLFENYIGRTEFKQVLLGNTEEKYKMIVEELKKREVSYEHISHLPVPFAKVNDFNYENIASQLKELNADIVWVSLGAPKQEWFMFKLLPYLNRGVMFGIGAAFDFYIGKNNQPKFHLGALRFIWLDRIFREPRKQLKRVQKIIRSLPLLYIDEKKRYKAIIEKCGNE